MDLIKKSLAKLGVSPSSSTAWPGGRGKGEEDGYPSPLHPNDHLFSSSSILHFLPLYKIVCSERRKEGNSHSLVKLSRMIVIEEG